MVRQKEEEGQHYKAVTDIAKKRFPFPNNDHPNWKTYMNPNGERNKGISKNHEVVYPDIVVVDMDKNQAAMIGEVETASTLTEDESKQWREYSSLCNVFYLYVPFNFASDAKNILDSKGIQYLGLRTYEYDSEGKIIIRDV